MHTVHEYYYNFLMRTVHEYNNYNKVCAVFGGLLPDSPSKVHYVDVCHKNNNYHHAMIIITDDV